jgi:GNAT superfamily N-acetyltransferase
VLSSLVRTIDVCFVRTDMSADLGTTAHADVARESQSGALVGFMATIPNYGQIPEPGKPRAQARPVRREHRVVVLPSWQGLGLGPRLSDLSAALWVQTASSFAHDDGRTYRYMAKTQHPRFGTPHHWQHAAT